MGTHKNSCDRKGKDLSELQSNGRSKKNRRRSSRPTPLQTLFETCEEVFAFGGVDQVPPPAYVERLRQVLDNLSVSDVGLSPHMPYSEPFVAGQTPVIKYRHFYEGERFSFGIFYLPPSGVIPLHNHPGMTVFSKLLLGKMHIKSYDWATDPPTHSTSAELNIPNVESSSVRLAKVEVDSYFTAPCRTVILYPSAGGNMHRFTALTACAVLDVVGPPYSDPDGRHCQYYLDFPIANGSGDEESVLDGESERYAWLQETDKPEGLTVEPF